MPNFQHSRRCPAVLGLFEHVLPSASVVQDSSHCQLVVHTTLDPWYGLLFIIQTLGLRDILRSAQSKCLLNPNLKRLFSRASNSSLSGHSCWELSSAGLSSYFVGGVAALVGCTQRHVGICGLPLALPLPSPQTVSILAGDLQGNSPPAVTSSNCL